MALWEENIEQWERFHLIGPRHSSWQSHVIWTAEMRTSITIKLRVLGLTPKQLSSLVKFINCVVSINGTWRTLIKPVVKEFNKSMAKRERERERDKVFPWLAYLLWFLEHMDNYEFEGHTQGKNWCLFIKWPMTYIL